MTATFFRHGEGRSINAQIAEGDGKMPLTRAVREVARLAGVTRKVARDACLRIGAREWHHVGKYAAECDYYDVAEVVDYISAAPKLAALPADWQERISSAMRDVRVGTLAAAAARDEMCQRLATSCGLSAEAICNYYYSLKRVG